MASLTERMIGAAKLDAATYEEVEADQTAIGQAMLVVVIANVAAGIGAFRQLGVGGMIITTVVALVGWYIWAFVTHLIGTRFLPGPNTQADRGQLLRTLGFAAAPGMIRVLGVVPGVGWLVSLVAALWMLAAMVVAVRQALDYESTPRAVAVCLIGFVLYVVAVFVVTAVLMAVFGIPGAAMTK